MRKLVSRCSTAHMHHAWDVYTKYGRTKAALRHALMSSSKSFEALVVFAFSYLFLAVQLAYTTLFGFHTSYLFLRTGSVLPAITAHTFCNVMGLPQITSELKAMPNYRIGMWSPCVVLVSAKDNAD